MQNFHVCFWIWLLSQQGPKLGHHTDRLWCVNNLPRAVI